MRQVLPDNIQGIQKITQILRDDIKTPIIAQMRTLELVLEGVFGKLNNEQEEILRQTYKSANFLYKMTQELLTYCKYECGSIENLVEKLDFCVLVKECIVKSSKKQVKFISRVKYPFVLADKDKIEGAVLNLLSCALRHDDENICILLENSKDDLILSVYCKRKTPEYNFENIFDGKVKYNIIGEDLNLALCKKIIVNHAGQVFSGVRENKMIYGFSLPCFKENI